MAVTTQDADPTGGRPVVPSRGALRPLGLHEVRLVGGFWHQRQQVIGSSTLDHHRAWMDKLGWTGNFTNVEGGTGSIDRRGREFSDSEVYKLIEAMSWEVGRTGAVERDLEIAELTTMIADAQAPDGYLNTAFGRTGQRPRYSDLANGHELYCAGHLLQAVVARTRTRGGDRLLDVGRRVADHVCDTFGKDGLWGFCGHPVIEAGLVELARLTGEQRYLDQAALFVERRGHRTLPQHEFGWAYYSDDIPVREAKVLRGHAVRSLYLSSGAVDLAVETGDTELLEVVAAQFARTLERRTYLTGGMGSRHLDEAFGEDFALPPDRAYSETCAGVAAIMLAWRLLLATGEARYSDLIERILYNVIATAISDDGRSFFYANTLHQRTRTEPLPEDKEQLRFGGGPRAPWFEVSCCLANIARTVASLGTYAVTADADGLQLHQYADAEVSTRLDDGRRVGLAISTNYPTEGAIGIRVTETERGPWAISLRVPDWAAGAVLVDADGRRTVPAGAVVVRREFAVGDELRLELPVRPRFTLPDRRIDAVRGCVAVERGPVVYCAESIDQGTDDLEASRIDVGVAPVDAVAVDPAQTDGLASLGAEVLVHGYLDRQPSTDWPYHEADPAPGAADSPPDAAQPATIRLVPYHRWARRGPSTMRVWLPRT